MTATPRTETDLVRAVMEESGLVDSTGDIASNDDDLVKRRYREKLDEIRQEGLAYWPPDAIPLEVFPALRKLIANEIGPAYGIAFNPQVEEWARRQLRRIIGKKTSGVPTPAEYF